MQRLIRSWIPLAIVVTGVCALVLVTVQQNYRQSLNDPQIQMAEDGASKLEAGNVPADLVPTQRQPTVDIATSLAPWIAVYDQKGTPLESSAFFNNAPPQPPLGIFDDASTGNGKDTTEPHENRVTWQPQPGVRQAVVVVAVTSGPSKGYFVVAGRSMREVETREGDLTTMVGFAWVVTLLASLFAAWFCGQREIYKSRT